MSAGKQLLTFQIVTSYKTLMFNNTAVRTSKLTNILYILESNTHPFYSFRGPKSRVRIRFAVERWILEK
jgi:hypothetical protein